MWENSDKHFSDKSEDYIQNNLASYLSEKRPNVNISLINLLSLFGNIIWLC